MLLRLIGVLVLAAVAGCTPPAAEPETPETYRLDPREVRPDERPVRIGGKDDDTEFALIGFSRLPDLIGSHAQWEPDGEYFRIRLAVTNVGRSTTLFDARRQSLVLADGTTHQPDSPAMLGKRQPEEFPLGSNVRLEFDLYYDIPPGAKVETLRVFGGGTLTDAADTEGTDIPLR